jgi:hypothetical protein
MKRLSLALVAAVAVACSAGPTAPSALVDGAATIADQNHKPNPDSPTHTITLYFLANGFDLRRPVGLPVTVWSDTVAAATLYVGPRGSVTFTIPNTDLWIGYSVPDWNGVCGVTYDRLAIPGGNTPEWNHTERLKTGCVAP